MNETELERMIVRLVGDGSQYQRMMENAVNQTQDAASKCEMAAKGVEKAWASATGGLSLLVGAVVGAGAAWLSMSELKNSFRAFEEREAGIIKMNAALEGNGRNVAETTAEYRKFANELEKVSTNSVGTTMDLLRQAETFGLTGKHAENAVKNAVAFGAATGESAGMMLRLTKALESGDIAQAKMFARYVPQLRHIKDDNEFVAKAQTLINIGLKTAEEQANTTGNQFDRIGRATKGIQVAIGEVINEAIKPLVTWLAEAAIWVKDKITPYFHSFAEMVKNAWVVIKQRANEAWEWLKPIRQALVSFWEAVVEKAQQAWNFVETTAISTWASIKDAVAAAFKVMGVDLNTLRDDVRDAFLLAEFAVRNWEKVWRLMSLRSQLDWLALTESFKFFFTGQMPAFINWLNDNWRSMLNSMHFNTVKLFNNLLDNVAKFREHFNEILHKGIRGAKIDWTPLGDGMEQVVKELPKIPAREMTKVELQIEAEWRALANQLGGDFATFRQKRLDEFAKAGADESKKAGEAIGANLGKGIKDGLSKLEPALAGSAEAFARMIDFQAQLQKNAAKAAGGGAGGPAGGAAPVPVKIDNQPAAAAPVAGQPSFKDSLRRTEELLEQIARSVGAKVNPLKAANVGAVVGGAAAGVAGAGI